MCLSKFNLLSISKPKSVTLFSELISLPSIVNFVGLFVCPFLSIIIDWNLSGLTIILFTLNHSVALFDSISKLVIKSPSVSDEQLIVLSSAKLWSSEFSIFNIHWTVISNQLIKSCVIRQKAESQNECFKKTKHPKFPEKRTFLTPWYALYAHGVQGVKRCLFFRKFSVLCFPETPVLTFPLLAYSRRSISFPIRG